MNRPVAISPSSAEYFVYIPTKSMPLGSLTNRNYLEHNSTTINNNV